jgi:16S rRNA (cytosine1407-C5)-methyltransferase
MAPGGSLVYCTCALSPEENDSVAERLLNKYTGDVELDQIDLTNKTLPGIEKFTFLDRNVYLYEKTKFGVMILPDTAKGAGPMYIARFAKKAG